MKALLVRVGADQSEGGGYYNGLVDSRTWDFAYVPIPESKEIHPGFDRPYSLVGPILEHFSAALPNHLTRTGMHLDPDFEHLSYGDQGKRAEQIQAKLHKGDLLVFYAGLKTIVPAPRLTYAIIGLYVIDNIASAVSISTEQRNRNAHTRRILKSDASDIVVTAKAGVSGRLMHCIPIGSHRTPRAFPNKKPCYRVDSAVLEAWGGLSVSDGYIQRSARLPEFLNAARFYDWFNAQNPMLLQRNN